MSTNHVTIVGNLGADPEIRFTPSGKAVCSFSVADQKAKRNDQGQWENVSDTLWVRITLWDADAEHAAEVLRRGDTVIATGRLIARNYTTQAGEQRQSLDLDFPTVGKVVRAPRQQQQGGYATQQPAADPWGTSAAQQSGGDPNYDLPPF